MSWKPSSETMIARFDRLLPVDPRVERRTMFGCPMGYANGNVFLGLHEDRFIIRLGEDDRAAFIKEFKAKAFEPMPGRKSSATLVVPERIAAKPAALRSWCGKALAHALSLPPKKAKKAKIAAKTTAGRKTAKPRLKSGGRKKEPRPEELA
jgi:TfoX/Sxy family transcriptional regulator of competence genes